LATVKEKYVVSFFMETVYHSHTAGIVVTVLILIVALSSLFAVMLGYSRVSYAAAKDGLFLPQFAKLHPTKNFPYVSLLVLAGLAFIFSMLFRMGHIIDGILAMRILVQFIGQAIGVIFLRKRNGTSHLKYKMPLYPIPVILVILMWLGIFIATGLKVISFFLIVFTSGLLVYYFFVRKKSST
jgi:fructoselysine transporter